MLEAARECCSCAAWCPPWPSSLSADPVPNLYRYMELFLLWSRNWLFPLWNFRRVCQPISPAWRGPPEWQHKHHHTGEQTTAPSFVLSTIQPCLVLQSLVVLTPPTKISDSGKYQMSSQNPVIVTSLKKYTQGGVVWLHLKSLGFSAVFANFRPASRRKMLYCSDILQNKSEIFLSKTCWS